jgi:hypothetical protein
VFSRIRSLVIGAAVGVSFSAPFAAPLAAQLPIPRFGVVGGVSSSRPAGTTGDQSNPIAALRVDLPLVFFLAEGSLAVTRWELTGGVRRTYLIPEAQAQWQFLPALVRPYIGAGVGWLNPLSGGGNVTTYSASAGVRAGLPLIPIGFRAEARIRAGNSDGFKRQATEFTVGVTF